jgi:hypothetical protein
MFLLLRTLLCFQSDPLLSLRGLVRQLENIFLATPFETSKLRALGREGKAACADRTVHGRRVDVDTNVFGPPNGVMISTARPSFI